MTINEEDSMSELYQSLSHSKWDCKYHVVFVPKRRRKVIFGQTRQQFGTDLPLAGAAEGMPDSRRASDARPCTHVHRDSPQAPGGFGDRVSEKGKVPLRLPGCAARNGISRANISGPGAMPSPPSASNWSRSVNTYASRMRRMEQSDNSESPNKARNARRLDPRPDRL